MEKREMEQKITAFIREHSGMEEVDLEMDLMDDIGFSSMDVMDLVARCEAAFAVKISSRDLRRVYTPRDLADLVEKKVNGTSV